MSRAVNGIVIGLAVFVLVAGSFWYLAVATETEKLKIDTDMAFTSADRSHTRFSANLTLTNRYDVDITLLKLAFRFRVDDLDLASNQTSGELPLKPDESHVEHATLDVPTDFVSAWLKNHVTNGEKSRAVFEGNATFRVGTKNETITFDEGRDFSTSIKDSLSDAANCPRPAGEPCLDKIEAAWVEKHESRVLVLSADLKNEGQDEVKIDRPTAHLKFGNVEVAKAEGGGTLLAPGSSHPVDFELYLEHEKLKEWLPEHFHACESSALALEIGFTYQIHPVNRTTSTPTPTTPSTPPTFTPSNTTVTSSSVPPTTTSTEPSPTPTPTTPSPTPTPTPTSSTPPSTSTSTSTSTTTSSTGATTTASSVVVTLAPGAHIVSGRVTYLAFADDAEAVQNRTADWNLEGKKIETSFVCEHDDGGLIGLP